MFCSSDRHEASPEFSRKQDSLYQFALQRPAEEQASEGKGGTVLSLFCEKAPFTCSLLLQAAAHAVKEGGGDAITEAMKALEDLGITTNAAYKSCQERLLQLQSMPSVCGIGSSSASASSTSAAHVQSHGAPTPPPPPLQLQQQQQQLQMQQQQQEEQQEEQQGRRQQQQPAPAPSPCIVQQQCPLRQETGDAANEGALIAALSGIGGAMQLNMFRGLLKAIDGDAVEKAKWGIALRRVLALVEEAQANAEENSTSYGKPFTY
jgi:hypothetical protein